MARSQESDWCKWKTYISRFFFFFLFNFCSRFISLEPGPIFSVMQLSMWVVVTSSAVASFKEQTGPEGKIQGGHRTKPSPEGTQVN